MINLILFCFGTAGFTLFLDMCFKKGMIFRKYYNWITYWFYIDRIKWVDLYYGGNTPNPFRIKKKNKFVWLWKVLGGCVYCFGTWVFIIFYTLVFFVIYG